MSITEQYLLQQHAWAPQGRASNLAVQHQPLVQAESGAIWKKGKPAFWEQLQARLTIIQNQPAQAKGEQHGFQGGINGNHTAVGTNVTHAIHESTTADLLEQRLNQTCELLEHEAPEPDLPATRAVGKKITRASIIAELLHIQKQHPVASDEHAYQETTGYLQCSKCNLSVHK